MHHSAGVQTATQKRFILMGDAVVTYAVYTSKIKNLTSEDNWLVSIFIHLFRPHTIMKKWTQAFTVELMTDELKKGSSFVNQKKSGLRKVV